jgi:hypothetical protein
MSELLGLPIDSTAFADAGELCPTDTKLSASSEVAHSAENLWVFIIFSFYSGGLTLPVCLVWVSLADVSYAPILLISRYSMQ